MKNSEKSVFLLCVFSLQLGGKKTAHFVKRGYWLVSSVKILIFHFLTDSKINMRTPSRNADKLRFHKTAEVMALYRETRKSLIL